MFPATSFDPETLSLLSRVFDEAWVELRSRWATSRWTQRPFAQRSRNASWRQQKAASGIQMAEVDRPSGSRRLERKAFRGILDGE